MIIKKLIENVDIQKCINELVILHRKHYQEPGYILSSNKITERYNHVFDMLREFKHTTKQHTINFEKALEQYNLYVGDKLLRDWFVDNKKPYNIIYYMKINAPKNLTLMAVLLEVIFELTYYSFPETVENPV